MSNTTASILGFLMIVIAAIFSYFLLDGLLEFLSRINPNPNIIVALIAGVVTVSGYFITRYFERKKIIEQQIREQKLPVYEEFISFIFKVIMNVKNGTETDQKEMEAFMIEFTKKSMVWMSDKSLKSFADWKTSAGKFADADNKDMNATMKQMLILEAMFFQFRKDIGHSNKGLKKGDLLALFINDLHKYDLG